MDFSKEEELPVLEDEEEEKEDFPIFKNKIDIEKVLFDEFNQSDIKHKEEEKEEKIELPEKLPNMSLDEYMDNFEEDKVKESD